MPLQILPMAVVVAVAFSTVKPNEPAVSAVVLLYGIALSVIAVAFVVSTIGGLGLRLVEIEHRINEATGAIIRDMCGSGLCWYSRGIAESMRHEPGFKWNAVLV